MGARFAGSQRLGDRRRRRLAVQPEDGARELSAPAGRARAIDGPHSQGVSESSGDIHFPVSKLVPEEWWKHLVVGLACLAISAGLLAAGALARDWSPVLGPGIERLFAFPDAPAARWFSSLLLLLSAQLTLLIWWARSRSHKDFNGQYWLWIRAALVWLAFSGGIASAAHRAAFETIQHIRPGLPAGLATLAWLLPAMSVGVWMVGALGREMQGCRPSRTLLFLAAAAYLSAAGLAIDFQGLIAPAMGLLLRRAFLLSGHVSLFLSMWWHARHVLYCCPDPAIRAESKARIPGPHFRLLSRYLSRSGPKQSAPEAQREPTEKPVTGKARSARNCDPALPPEGESATDDRNAPTKERTRSTRKPHLLVDDGHQNPPEPARSACVDSTGSAEPSLDAVQTETSNPETAPPAEQEPDGVERPAVTNDGGAEMEPNGDPSAGNPAVGEDESKPDLRGLSKKQRRRLMQELRDRERAAGR